MFVLKKIRQIGGIAAALLVVLTAVLPAATASAQTAPVRPPLNLMTSPLPLNVVTKPGQSVTADIRVKNNGAQPETLKVELLKFGAEDESGRPKLLERDPQDRYFDWVKFSDTNFTADPNVWKTVKMTINPPKEAAFGYYYAVLFSRSSPQRPTGGASGVEGGVASLVLLNVDAPGSRRQAEVAELIAGQKVYEFLPAEFTVKLKNSGNVHVSPVGSMFIKRGNTQVASLGFNQENGNILPGTSRTFDLSWQEGFPAYVTKGTGESATRELKWDFGKIQNLRFGRYTATLVAVYDDGERDIPIEAEVSFWVIPWRILGVILLIILLVGGGTWAILRLVWKGFRKQVVRVPSAAPATPSTKTEAPVSHDPAPAPVVPVIDEDEPEENSLAAHLKRKKDTKKQDKKQKQRDQEQRKREQEQRDLEQQRQRQEAARQAEAAAQAAQAAAVAAAEAAAKATAEYAAAQKRAAAETHPDTKQQKNKSRSAGTSTAPEQSATQQESPARQLRKPQPKPQSPPKKPKNKKNKHQDRHRKGKRS
jgi:hypothetical protein